MLHWRGHAAAVCFNAFDVDGSGNLDEDEFLKLANAVQGGDGATFPGNFKRALQEFDMCVWPLCRRAHPRARATVSH